MGHAEAAAGHVGIAQLSRMLTQANRCCMTHLRSINPHISSLLDGHTKPGPAALTIQAGRQDAQNSGPPPEGGIWERMASISAFAFQVSPVLVSQGIQLIKAENPSS